MKKLLITGASGFVGSHMCELLVRDPDWEVCGTVFGNDNQIKDLVRAAYEINLMDYEAVAQLILKLKPAYILHLAALTSPAASYGDLGQTLSNNMLAQYHLLEAVRAAHYEVGKIVIVGSAEEYGLIRPEDNPVSEMTPLNPTSPYAVSKITQDFMGLQYFLTYQLPIVRLRPFNHTGERQAPVFVIPAFAKQVAAIEQGAQEPVIQVGNLEPIRDFTDVKDMVRAYLLALQSGEPGEVYNLGSGRGMKIGDILKLLMSWSKREIQVKEDPEKLRPADVPKMIADSQKFFKLTGWKTTIPLEETVRRVLDYWRLEVAKT